MELAATQGWTAGWMPPELDRYPVVLGLWKGDLTLKRAIVSALGQAQRNGEVATIIGPNGAGKSTFFNMISGVDDPTEGEVQLMGRTMQMQPSRAFAALGLSRTFQHVRLLEQRSVVENVALGAHRRARRGWVASMLRLDRAEEAALLAEARVQIERCGLGARRSDWRACCEG